MNTRWIERLGLLQLVFMDLLNKKLYVTRDEGQTFVAYPVSFGADWILFHPEQEDRILAYASSDRAVSASFCAYRLHL